MSEEDIEQQELTGTAPALEMTPELEARLNSRWSEESQSFVEPEKPAEAETDETDDAETQTEAAADKTVGEGQPETKAKPEAPSGELDSHDLLLAKTYGVPIDAAQEMGPRGLRAHVRLIESAQVGRQVQNADPPVVKSFAEEMGIDPNEYDPKMLAAMEKLHADNRSMAEQIQQRAAQETYQAQDAYFDTFDTQVIGMKDEAIYGKGKIGELPADSKEVQNRIDLVNRVDFLREEYRVARRPVPELSELIEQAHYSLHGKTLIERTKQSALKNVQRSITDRSKQRLGVPSRSSGVAVATKELHKDPEIVERFESYKRENGDV